MLGMSITLCPRIIWNVVLRYIKSTQCIIPHNNPYVSIQCLHLQQKKFCSNLLNKTWPNRIYKKSKLTQSNLPIRPSKVETLNKVKGFDPWIRCVFGNVLPFFIAVHSICAICCFVQPIVWELAALAISSCASSCDDPPANGGLYYGLKFAVMPSDGQQRGVKSQGLTSRWCYCPNIKANQLIRTRLSSLILMVQNLFWQNNRGWKSQLMGVHFWGQKHISNSSLILSLNSSHAIWSMSQDITLKHGTTFHTNVWCLNMVCHRVVGATSELLMCSSAHPRFGLEGSHS